MIASELLREARLRLGLTQAELARRAGVSQSAISRWERAGARPSLDTLSRLLRAGGLELRVGLAEIDPAEESLLAQQLGLTPSQRLDQLVRTVRFIERGRQARPSGG